MSLFLPGPLLIDIVDVAGAALTTLCWLPQATKILRDKETRALSLPGTAAFTLGIAHGWSTAWPSTTGR